MYINSLKKFACLLNLFIENDAAITTFCVDSRLVKQGDVFFALPGAKTDGHQYLAEVASKGAVAAVVSRAYQGPDFGMVLLPVEDPFETLQEAGKSLVQTLSCKIVGITGSVGKTTTKEFTAAILKQKYRVFATPGNNNSQIGIPLALLNHLQGNEEILIIEMGMTHSGNITALTKIVPPHVALLTAVELVHAANFNSLSEIAQAKAEIFSHPDTELGILNYELEDFEEICKVGSCPKLSFSVLSSCADYYLFDENGQLKIVNKQGRGDLGSFNILGRHNRKNLLAAIACARFFEMDWEEIKAALPTLVLPERRLEILEKQGIVFINDSYNASAVSVKAALEALPAPKYGGKKIAVIGEMLELGKFSRQCHREVAEKALETVDYMLCMGPECREIYDCWVSAQKNVEWFQTRADLVDVLRKIASPGDVVLLKGSRANLLWKVLEEI